MIGGVVFLMTWVGDGSKRACCDGVVEFVFESHFLPYYWGGNKENTKVVVLLLFLLASSS